MATPLKSKKIENIGIYGLIRPAEVDDTLIPDGAVTESINFHFDRKGAATVRSGIAVLGGTVLTARPSVGFHNALSGTAIVVFSNGSSSTIYSHDGTEWSVSLDGGTASVRVRFVDFGSYTIAINFIQNTYSSMRFWNAGSSRHWHHTGGPINPQNMWGRNPQMGDVYKNRIYLAGDTSQEGNPSRLYFSSVISSTGLITWSPTVDFVDINPGDGENITALKRYSTDLLVMKPSYIYRFRTVSVEPDPLIKIGTRSHESVIEGNRGLYFHHDSGFYRYSGEYPIIISRSISDVVIAIPFSQYDDIVAWNDSDHIYWSVGNVTVTESGLSETWRNVVLRYTESSDIWTILSYANDIRRGMTYTRGTTLSRLVALDNGSVATFDSGSTDLGEPIEFRLRTRWYDAGEIAERKILEEIVAVTEKQQTAQLFYQVDENPAWYSLGQLKSMISFFDKLSIRFHRIRFRVGGITRFEAPILRSINLTKGINEGMVKENRYA